MKEKNKILKKMPAYIYVITFCIYLASFVIVLIFNNSIFVDQDMERYHFCDIVFKENVSQDMLNEIEQYVDKRIDVLNFVALRDTQMGTYELIQGKIAAGDGELVAYGSQPFFVEVNKSGELGFAEQINTAVIEFKHDVSLKDVKIIKKFLNDKGIKAKVLYTNTAIWLWQNIEFYKYMVIMVLGIVVFAESSIMLILKSWFEKEKKRIAVYILCGADNKVLKNKYVKNYTKTIAFSYLLAACVLVAIAIIWNRIGSVLECVLPGICGLVIAAVNYIIFLLQMKNELSKNFISLWRKSL